MIVDIGKSGATGDKEAPTAAGRSDGTNKRHGLQHQASLSASAAVGAASEAGRFLASKLVAEVNLKSARDLVKAAAANLTEGATQGPRIKFQNLRGDEDEEEEEEEEPRAAGSSAADEDEEEDSDRFARRQRFVKQSSQQKRSRRGQSVLSAALSSYKQKQKGGYRKAANDEDFDEDEDDFEEDEDEDERVNLNRSASYKGKVSSKARQAAAAAAANELSSSTDDRLTPNTLLEARGDLLARGSSGARDSGLDGGSTTSLLTKKSTSSRRVVGPQRQSRRNKSLKRGQFEEDDDEDFDREAGRTYRCLDNSVALLIKTRFEETLLRIALVAIIFVAIGLFILLSLPPAPPPPDVVELLIKT